MSIQTQPKNHTTQIADTILKDVLSPYKNTQTDYLKKANIHIDGDSTHATIKGNFTIPHSCYIDSTGHFNAVEFIICYNQLAYTACGYFFYHDLWKKMSVRSTTSEYKAQLLKINYTHYLKNQLGSSFILRSNLKFKNIINPINFNGQLSLIDLTYRKNTFFLSTECFFSNNAIVCATGKITLAYRVEMSD